LRTGAQCGIPKAQRFAFYDQVHTTGMDIQVSAVQRSAAPHRAKH
jgi:hypothetical protein